MIDEENSRNVQCASCEGRERLLDDSNLRTLSGYRWIELNMTDLGAKLCESCSNIHINYNADITILKLTHQTVKLMEHIDADYVCITHHHGFIH